MQAGVSWQNSLLPSLRVAPDWLSATIPTALGVAFVPSENPRCSDSPFMHHSIGNLESFCPAGLEPRRTRAGQGVGGGALPGWRSVSLRAPNEWSSRAYTTLLVCFSFPRWGQWSKVHRCPQGHLSSFQLQVEPLRWGTDNTAANNLRMKCQTKVVLEVPWAGWGAWGPWSPRCPKGGICGLQTRVQTPQRSKDDTALNDVVFFCCC